MQHPWDQSFICVHRVSYYLFEFGGYKTKKILKKILTVQFIVVNLPFETKINCVKENLI